MHPSTLFWVGDAEPVFEKCLSNTDIKHRFAFPTKHLHHLINLNNPDHSRNLLGFSVIDGSGIPFYFPLNLRGEKYLKPEITGGWLLFVNRKNLQLGDRVIFYKRLNVNSNNGALFTITVQKRIMRLDGTVDYGIEV